MKTLTIPDILLFYPKNNVSSWSHNNRPEKSIQVIKNKANSDKPSVKDNKCGSSEGHNLRIVSTGSEGTTTSRDRTNISF